MVGAGRERHCVRETRRIWVWALLWPLIVIVLATFVSPWAWLGLMIYPLHAFRTARWRHRTAQDPWSQCLLYGISCVAANWPQSLGQINYWRNRFRGRQSVLIEYKN